MLKLTKKADYALVLVTQLAKQTGYISIRDVADTANMPYKFLSQIATDLKKAGIVKSKEGIGGGYRLARPPRSITLSHIITAVDGPIAPVTCMKSGHCRCQDVCQHRDVMHELSRQLEQSLQKITLADLKS
jgi:Rrf2 family transcriptional regulator, cysteine metabolism repressor